MPVPAMINRIRGDFVSTMVPGFFIMSLIIITFTLSLESAPVESRKDVILAPAGILEESWVVFLSFLFSCYIIGVIVKSIPVDWGFPKIPILNKYKGSKFPHKRLYYKYYNYYMKGDFIYKLSEYCKNSEKIKVIGSNNVATNSDPMFDSNGFNFIKMFICASSPGNYSILQELESRSRLYGAMRLTGLIGVLISFFLYFMLSNNGTLETWFSVNFTMFTLSLIILVIFGLQIRRIRRDEARHVYLSLFAIIRSRDRLPVS